MLTRGVASLRDAPPLIFNLNFEPPTSSPAGFRTGEKYALPSIPSLMNNQLSRVNGRTPGFHLIGITRVLVIGNVSPRSVRGKLGRYRGKRPNQLRGRIRKCETSDPRRMEKFREYFQSRRLRRSHLMALARSFTDVRRYVCVCTDEVNSNFLLHYVGIVIAD